MALRSSAEGPPVCEAIKSFLARQGIIIAAALLFLIWTAWRVRRGYDRRDLRTFVCDASKQAGQQAMGGVMILLLGQRLSNEHGYSPLAWCGAIYPFEIVLATASTQVRRSADGRATSAMALPAAACVAALARSVLGRSGR